VIQRVIIANAYPSLIASSCCWGGCRSIFVNGFHDCRQFIATVVSYPVFDSRPGCRVGAVFQFIAAFTFGRPSLKRLGMEWSS